VCSKHLGDNEGVKDYIMFGQSDGGKQLRLLLFT
jgi:hypothetical protein